MNEYIKLSNEEAQVLRALGYERPFGWCPYNGIVVQRTDVNTELLAAALTLIECGRESRSQVSSTFVGDFMSDIIGVFDCPDNAPSIRDLVSFAHETTT